jgi:hypothetical protein
MMLPIKRLIDVIKDFMISSVSTSPLLLHRFRPIDNFTLDSVFGSWYAFYCIRLSKIAQQDYPEKIGMVHFKWRDVESLLKSVGVVISERAGSRVAVFHRPHPSPNMDKGAVRDLQIYEDF